MSMRHAFAALALAAFLFLVNPPAFSAATPRPNAVSNLRSAIWMPHTLYVGSSGLVEVTLSVTTATLKLSSFQLAGANASLYAVTRDRCTGTTLYIGHTCTIDFQVTASVPYGIDAQVSLVTDQGPAVVDVPVDTPAQPLKYGASELNFVHVPYMTTATDHLLVTNPNPIAIDLDMMAGGFDPGVYNEYDIDPGTCNHIPANSFCTLTFHFTPTAGWYGSWNAPLARDDASGRTDYLHMDLIGDGVYNKARPVSLKNYYNVNAFIEQDGELPLQGGLDGFGHAYPFASIDSYWLNQQFNILQSDGPALNAVANATLSINPGNYYGVALLGTAVFGPLEQRPFVLQYSDGTSSTILQSLSDWKTPRHFPNEDIAYAVPYRTGPRGQSDTPEHQYNLYGYVLPVDHDKTLMSIVLPPTRNVIVLALNVMSYPMNKPVDMSSAFNVVAIRHDGTQDSTGGIDRQGSAISYEALTSAAVLNDIISVSSIPNQPNAATSTTVVLPAGEYASLRMLGTAVNGTQLSQTLVVSYTDGTQAILQQSFSDWHNTQSVYHPYIEHERRNMLMPYRLNKNGSSHTGMVATLTGSYMIYEYSVPLDPTKTVLSVQLPNNKNVVILSMYVQP